MTNGTKGDFKGSTKYLYGRWRCLMMPNVMDYLWSLYMRPLMKFYSHSIKINVSFYVTVNCSMFLHWFNKILSNKSNLHAPNATGVIGKTLDTF